MTQATAERITELIHDNVYCYGGDIDGVVTTGRRIAAEIDALILQRDEATAKAKSLTLEVERLRPAAEAWEAWEAWNRACNADPLPPPEDTRHLHRTFWAAAARAREAAKGAA